MNWMSSGLVRKNPQKSCLDLNNPNISALSPVRFRFFLYLYVSLSLKHLLEILDQMNSLPRYINVAWCSGIQVSWVRPDKQHWENKKGRHVRGLLPCTQSQRREGIKCPTAERTQNCYMISSVLMQASVTQSLSLLLLLIWIHPSDVIQTML